MTVVPAAFNYSDQASANLAKYAVIVPGRAATPSVYAAALERGARIAQYVNLVDVGPRYGPYDERFEAAGTPVLGVSNWAGFKVVDLSDAAHRDSLVEAMKWALSQETITDLLLDVFGERLWSAAWGQMSAAQQASFAAGNHDLADRFGAVRDQYRPDARLWANGTWSAGHPALCPVVEHHDSEMPTSPDDFWWQYVDAARWDASGQGAAFIIASTLSAAGQWAKVPGVGPIAAQGDYAAAPANALGYATLAPRIVAAPPPDVEPPADPCADVKAQLATASAARDAAVEQAREAASQLDAARKLIASTREDLDKIRGSAKTIAARGKVIPADVGRATGIQTAAERAIAAIDDATKATTG